MSRIEIQKNVELEKELSLEEIIIAKSMNGWILQLYQQFFNKKSN